MNWSRSPGVAILALAIAACGSDDPDSLDPMATYEVYGEQFEPGVAIPVQAVLAESHAFVDRKVIVEGVAHDECPEPDCLTMMAPGSDGQIHIFMDLQESDTFYAPGEIAGRRIVAGGRLQAVNDSTFRLHATGIMTEKVRR